MDRRDFLRFSAGIAVAGLALQGRALAGPCGKLSFPGIVYTGEEPGRWAGKVGSHLPVILVDGGKVTITTNHPMSERHYIVRHTLVAEDGTVLGEKTFYPTDERAVSVFEVVQRQGVLYATSFCNLHDFWVARFTMGK